MRETVRRRRLRTSVRREGKACAGWQARWAAGAIRPEGKEGLTKFSVLRSSPEGALVNSSFQFDVRGIQRNGPTSGPRWSPGEWNVRMWIVFSKPGSCQVGYILIQSLLHRRLSRQAPPCLKKQFYFPSLLSERSSAQFLTLTLNFLPLHSFFLLCVGPLPPICILVKAIYSHAHIF